jgi:hypothetical protein
MNFCLSGMKRKYALDRPTVLEIWLIQLKTNFTQDEIKSFEEVGFVLNKQQPMFLRNLFVGENSILMNPPLDEMLWPTSRNGKDVHFMMPFKMSNLHYNQWEVGRLFEVIVNPPFEGSPLGYG